MEMRNTKIFENWLEQNQKELKKNQISFLIKKTTRYRPDDWAFTCEFESTKLSGTLTVWDEINYCDIEILNKKSSNEFLLIESNEFNDSFELIKIFEKNFQKVVLIESDL